MSLVTSSIMPFHFGVGDHQAFIVNFLLELLEEEVFISIEKLLIRRLVLSQDKLVENYISKGEQLFEYHKI